MPAGGTVRKRTITPKGAVKSPTVKGPVVKSPTGGVATAANKQRRRRNSALSYTSSHRSKISKGSRDNRKKKRKGVGNPVWGMLAGALTAYVGSLNVVPDRFDSLYSVTAVYLVVGGFITILREGYRQKSSTARRVYPASMYTVMQLLEGDYRYGLFICLISPFLLCYSWVGKLAFLVNISRGISLMDGLGGIFRVFFRRRRKRRGRKRRGTDYSSSDSSDLYDSEELSGSDGYDSLSDFDEESDGSVSESSSGTEDDGELDELSGDEYSQVSEILDSSVEYQDVYEDVQEEVLEEDGQLDEPVAGSDVN